MQGGWNGHVHYQEDNLKGAHKVVGAHTYTHTRRYIHTVWSGKCTMHTKSFCPKEIRPWACLRYNTLSRFVASTSSVAGGGRSLTAGNWRG